MLLECFSRPWDIQKYQVISSLPKTKTILSEIIVLIVFFLSGQSEFHIWKSVKTLVELYYNSMPHDGYHLGTEELKIALNVTSFFKIPNLKLRYYDNLFAQNCCINCDIFKIWILNLFSVSTKKRK